MNLRAKLSCCLAGALLLGASRGDAQLVMVHSFIRAPQHPGQGTLVQATDGYLWGAAQYGGDFDAGAIFKVKPDGTDWQTVVSFSGVGGPNRGRYPASGLILGIDGNF